MRAHASMTPGVTDAPIADHHPLGMSTGVFESVRGRWSDLVDRSCAISSHAIELSALSADELPALLAYVRSEPRLPFRHIGVHAPVKGDALDERALARELRRLPLWVRSIVTHPDAVHDPAAYAELGTRLVLENMDGRKPIGRSGEELEPFFAELPEAGFCLDVAHAGALDRSMGLAHDLLDRFRSRLRQVHLSSLDAAGHHVPLSRADEVRFAEVLGRCRDVPWILEASPPPRWGFGAHLAVVPDERM